MADSYNRSSSRSTSLRDSEKLEGAGSWDSLEWTKIDPVSRSVSYENLDFLLEAESIIAEGYGVVLVNTDEAGTLIVTNFRLLFLSEGTRNILWLGTIPLATIEKFSKLVLKSPPVPLQIEKDTCQRLLQIIGKDLRIIVFNFRPQTKQRRAVFDALLRWTKPERLWDLYAFISGPSKYANVDPRVRLLKEYCRLLGLSAHQTSLETIETGSFTLSNSKWRISNANLNYTLCPTYPFAFIAPKGFSDEDIQSASKFRARSRFPIVTWCHPETGAVLARSSQPLVGIMMNARSNTDERLAAALCTEDSSGLRRKLYIADARPRKNALANGAKGGGSESSSNYFRSEVVFFGIDNIHAMRESFSRLRDYLDTQGATSSDGVSSYLRNCGWTWGGGNLSSMSASVSTLGDSGWLNHIQCILAGSAWIAARIEMESASVLVHCSDGWDRTSQLVALASLLLDPYYRTFEGFQALVEKDWLAYGHNFSDRCGTPTVSCSGGNMPFAQSRQSSTGSMNISSSTLRQSSSSFSSQNYQGSSPSRSQTSNHYSPIFLQWVDCISQLMRMYPSAFEFSPIFLVDLLDCLLSCRFGNFLGNCEHERHHAGISIKCGCMWAYLTDMRSSDVGSHAHYNIFYDRKRHSGPLLPPAAALAPTLWPQFHLRWACPMEAQAGEIEGYCRSLSKNLSDVEKANKISEMKVIELATIVESSESELERERQLRASAQNMAEKATRECEAIKRAIQLLGYQIHFSADGDLSVDVEGISKKVQPVGTELPSRGEANGVLECSASFNHSVSVSASAEDPLNRVCQSLCPLLTRDGSCRWPDAGCAQLGSQFAGFKAKFDAFDQLSVYDKYFGTE